MNSNFDTFKNAVMKIYVNNEWLLVNLYKLKNLNVKAFEDDEIIAIIYNNDKNKEIYDYIQKDAIIFLDTIGLFKVSDVHKDEEYKRIKANQNMYKFIMSNDEIKNISCFDKVWSIIKKEME